MGVLWCRIFVMIQTFVSCTYYYLSHGGKKVLYVYELMTMLCRGAGGTCTALNVWVLFAILFLCFGVPEPDQPLLSVWDAIVEDEMEGESNRQASNDSSPRSRPDGSFAEFVQSFDETSSSVLQFNPHSSEDNSDLLLDRKGTPGSSLAFQESIDFPSSSEDERIRSSSVP